MNKYVKKKYKFIYETLLLHAHFFFVGEDFWHIFCLLFFLLQENKNLLKRKEVPA